MHSPLHSRCTDFYMYTCALRQTPHGHMRRGVSGSGCNALTLYVCFASGTPFLYGVLHVQASTAVQPVHSTHMHFSSPLTQHYPTLCLCRPPNTSIIMHTPWYSRGTGVCVYTCARRQTPHGHMRRGVLALCAMHNSERVLRLKNTFPVWCTSCSGVHCRETLPQHTCAFLSAAYATLP